jgi:hypothetical protein
MGISRAPAARTTAYAVRPDDPNAIANLALARTIQRRFEEALALARRALAAVPRPNHAVANLLQAAARSGWQGEPESLIPADLVGSESTDLGLAEFLRWRSAPGWAERCLELSRRHPEVDSFKRVRALAILALALEKGDFFPGGRAPVNLEDLDPEGSASGATATSTRRQAAVRRAPAPVRSGGDRRIDSCYPLDHGN